MFINIFCFIFENLKKWTFFSHLPVSIVVVVVFVVGYLVLLMLVAGGGDLVREKC